MVRSPICHPLALSKHTADVLGNLVRLSESDRPFGIQAEVLRAVANMVVLLDEQFLVHSAVHKAVLRLLRGCVGDQIEEQVDGRAKPMGAASNAARSAPSEYEEDREYSLDASSSVGDSRMYQSWTCSAFYAAEYETTASCS
jgi:hypothetical protein